MKLHLTDEQVIEWVDSTYEEIEELLKKRCIPYEEGFKKHTDPKFGNSFYLHQIKFPWDDGDVVIGTLHWDDDLIIRGEQKFTYPSIETYHFPWDSGDVTVFDTPEEFIYTLGSYYIRKQMAAQIVK